MTSMATDISPIFGLPLVGMIEIATLIVAVAILVSASVTGYFSLENIRQTKTAIERQAKIDSARLSLELLESWSETKYPKFTAFVDRLYENNVREGDPQIPQYLNELESIAILWEEGVITENHVKQFFVGDLKAIRACKPVADYLKENCTGTTYAKLWKLYQKTADWD